MSGPEALLPKNATALERAASQATGRFAPPRIVPTLWNAAACPPALLPFLAWALSVDEWDHGWSVEKKRAVIAAARQIHKKKGTPHAIRVSLASVGQPDADIIERADCLRHNGEATRNGLRRRFGLAGWPTFRVILKRPVTIDQAFQIRRLLESTKRNCVVLLSVDFAQAALRRNGLHVRDGSYTRGVVNTSIN
ncbi:MAG: phage tail protein I [Denitratisoma sp.]|nr:phage tail protein I [Denitratisoma sp.]